MKKSTYLIMLLILFLTPAISRAAPPSQAPEGQTYVIQADDWLSKIAEKFLGDALAYDQVVEATNSKATTDESFVVISDPDIIEIGQKIWVPVPSLAAPELVGEWQSLSCEVRPVPAQSGVGVEPTFLRREITIENGQLAAKFRFFGDADCTFPVWDVAFSGDINIVGDMNMVADGAVQANLINDRASVTPQADFFVDLLNSGQACGANTWEAGIEQAVLPIGCDVLGFAPNSLLTEFETLLAKDGLLYFGARPVDGSSLSSPDDRPTTLQLPLSQVSTSINSNIMNIPGRWQSIASCELRPQPDGQGGVLPQYLTRDIRLTDSTISTSFKFFSDASCSIPSYNIAFSGGYEIIDAATDTGLISADLTINQATLTPQDEGFTGFLNSSNTCIDANWQIGEGRELFDEGCQLLGALPGGSFAEFETFLALENQLFFAARPVDGSGLDSPDKRWGPLQIPLERAEE